MNNKNKLFYGWVVTGGAFIVLFFAFCSGFYTFSVFLEPLQKTFGWSRTQISLAFTISALLGGVLSPLLGQMISKFGAKNLFLFGSILAGCSLLGLSTIQQLWQYYVIVAVMSVGLICTGQVTATTLITLWFEKRRGTAMGIIMVGIGLGSMAMVFISSMVTQAYGWRIAYSVLGLMTLVIGIPTILLTIKSKPEDMNLLPYGKEASLAPGDNLAQSEGYTIKQAMRTMSFWLICLILASGSFMLGGLNTNAIALIRSFGADNANGLWGFALGISVVGKGLFGYLFDKISGKALLAACFILHILGFIALAVASTYSWCIILFILAYGLGLGALLTLGPLLVGDMFGAVNFSKIYGLMGLFQVMGMAGGSVVLAKIYDSTASYQNAVVLMVVLSFTSFVFTILVRRPKTITNNINAQF